MKKRILIIYIGFFLSGLIVLSLKMISTNDKEEYAQLRAEEKILYSELVQKFDGNASRILFFYFDFNCESCQHKIQNFKPPIPHKSSDLLLFISGEDSLKSIKYLKDNLNQRLIYSYHYDKGFRIRNSLQILSIPTLLEIDRKNNRKKHVSSF